MDLRFRSPSPDATGAAAQLLAGAIPEAGMVVVISGPLGAGKTVFAKGLARGLGIDPAGVTSPTYAICCEYQAPNGRRLAHVDVYRVADVTELEEVGFLDLLQPGFLVAIEWGERFRDVLPEDRLEVTLARPEAAKDPTHRVLNAVASGPIAAVALAQWKTRLDGNLELSED